MEKLVYHLESDILELGRKITTDEIAFLRHLKSPGGTRYHPGSLRRFYEYCMGKFGMFRYMSTDGLYKNNEGTSPIADPFPQNEEEKKKKVMMNDE